MGCGWLIVPTMLIFGFSPDEAVGVGLLQMVPSTLMTVIKDMPKMSWGKRSVMRMLALPLGLGAVLTAFSGRYINAILYKNFGPKALLIIFAFVTIFIGLKTVFGKLNTDQNYVPAISKGQSFIALIFGMITGVLSSLLGIGGAMIFRPILANGFKIPEQITAKAVRLLLLVTTLTGGLFYLFSNGGFQVRILVLTFIIAFGGMIGFPLGVRCNNVVCKNGYSIILQKSFGVISVIILTNTILNLLGFINFSRYLMIFFAVLLFTAINIFARYTKKHPISK